jgi:hypothetical protein
MPRGSGQLAEGLARDRLDQRPGLRGIRHELRAIMMPSPKQTLPSDVDAGDKAEVDDDRSTADCRRSRLPRVL